MSEDEISDSMVVIMRLIAQSVLQDGLAGLISAITVPAKQSEYVGFISNIKRMIVNDIINKNKLANCTARYEHYLAVAHFSYENYGDLEIPYIIYETLSEYARILHEEEIRKRLSVQSLQINDWLNLLFNDSNNNSYLRQAYKNKCQLKSARWPIVMEIDRAYKLNYDNESLNLYLKSLGISIANYIDKFLLDKVHDHIAFDQIKMNVHDLLEDWQCRNRELLFGNNENGKHSLDGDIHQQYEKKIFALRKAYNEFYIERSHYHASNKKRIVLSLKNLLFVCVKEGYGIERLKGIINIYTHALNIMSRDITEAQTSHLADWQEMIDAGSITDEVLIAKAEQLELEILPSSSASIRNNLIIHRADKSLPVELFTAEILLKYCMSGSVSLDDHLMIIEDESHEAYRKIFHLFTDPISVSLFKSMHDNTYDYLLIFYEELLDCKGEFPHFLDKENLSILESSLDMPHKLHIIGAGKASSTAQHFIATHLQTLQSTELSITVLSDHGLSHYLYDDLVERVKMAGVIEWRVYHVTTENTPESKNTIVIGSKPIKGITYSKFKKIDNSFNVVNQSFKEYDLENIIRVWRAHSKLPRLSEFDLSQQLSLQDTFTVIHGELVDQCISEFISLIYAEWNEESEKRLRAIYHDVMLEDQTTVAQISRLYTICRRNHFYKIIVNLSDEGQPYLVHFLQDECFSAICDYFMISRKALSSYERQCLREFSWELICTLCHMDDLIIKFNKSSTVDITVLQNYSIQNTRLSYFIMLALPDPFAHEDECLLFRQLHISFDRLVPALKKVYFDSACFFAKANLQLLVVNKMRSDIDQLSGPAKDALIEKCDNLVSIINAGDISIDTSVETKIYELVKEAFHEVVPDGNPLIVKSVKTGIWLSHFRMNFVDNGFRRANTIILPIDTNNEISHYFKSNHALLNQNQLLENFDQIYEDYYSRRFQPVPFQTINHDFHLVIKVYVHLMIDANLNEIKDELSLKGWQVTSKYIYFANNSLGKSLAELIQIIRDVVEEATLLEGFNAFLRSGNEDALTRLKMVYQEALNVLIQPYKDYHHNHAFIKQAIVVVLQYILGLVLRSNERYLSTVLTHCKNHGWNISAHGELVVDDPILNDINLTYCQIYNQVIRLLARHKDEYRFYQDKNTKSEVNELYRVIDNTRAHFYEAMGRENTLDSSTKSHELLKLWNKATVKLSFFEKQRLHAMTSLFIELAKRQDSNKEIHVNNIIQAKNLLLHLNMPGIQYSYIAQIEKILDEMESSSYALNEKSMVNQLLEMVDVISHRVHAHDYLYNDQVVMDSLHELEVMRDFAKLTSPDLFEITQHLETIAPFFPHLQTVCCLTKEEVIFLRQLLTNLSGEFITSMA